MPKEGGPRLERELTYPLSEMDAWQKVGQQLALTGDLGRSYPSEGLRISSFAKQKDGNTTKLKQEQNKQETKGKGK